MFRLLCFQYKIVSVDYFMDRMNDYEVDSIIENIQYDDVAGWEQTRLRIFSTAQMMSKKKLTVKDIMVFPWEKEDEEEEEHKTSISNEEIEMLEKEAKKIQQQVYGK